MKYLKIFKQQNAVLKLVCKPVVVPLTDKVSRIIYRMEKWVDDSNNVSIQKKYGLRPAVGIAANQVGFGLRMFYISIKDLRCFFINPEIIEISWQKCFLKGGEGCLSVDLPERSIVIRRLFLRIKYYNYKIGKIQIKSFSGLPAIVIQHEIDHLNGIIYLDRVATYNNLSVLTSKINFDAVEITS